MYEINRQIEDISGQPSPVIKPDGTIHRFGSKKQLWVVVHSVGGNYYGAIGNWKTGQITKLGNTDRLNKYQQRELQRQIREQQALAKAERDAIHLEVAKQALEVWTKASQATATDYTIRKRIQPLAARQQGNTLILPLVDIDGQIWSLQRIYANGDKRFLAGGKKKACFIPVVWSTEADKLIICEGWATGCSLAEMYPDTAVVAACDAGNLESVAVAIKRTNPSLEIVIAADADKVGLSKAEKAAQSIGAEVIYPIFTETQDGSDFNDWLNLQRMEDCQ